MIRRLSILAAAALAVSAAPALASTHVANHTEGTVSLAEERTEDMHAVVMLIGANDYGLKQAVANHTEGTVTIWNNGDGNDLITPEHEGFAMIGAGKDRGWTHASFSIDIGTSEAAKQAGRLEWPVLDYVRTPVR
jgi:hypothetical protein